MQTEFAPAATMTASAATGAAGGGATCKATPLLLTSRDTLITACDHAENWDYTASQWSDNVVIEMFALSLSVSWKNIHLELAGGPRSSMNLLSSGNGGLGITHSLPAARQQRRTISILCTSHLDGFRSRSRWLQCSRRRCRRLECCGPDHHSFLPLDALSAESQGLGFRVFWG